MNEAQFARLVQERPDLARHFHFVRIGKDGRRGYYRRIPVTYRDRRARPASLLRVQVAFGEAAQSVHGKGGLTEGGQPLGADAVKKAMKNKEYRKPKWELAIEKLTEAMKEIVTVKET